jgi:integrase
MDRKWIVSMATKVNLKKYIAIEGRWRFVPVLKIGGKPRPEAVLIDGETVKGTTGTYYLEWREEGKRIQRPVGSASREAKDAWENQVAILDGTIEAPEEESEPLPLTHLSVASAIKTFLSEVKGNKSLATHDAYTSDLNWFKAKLARTIVGKVTRADIMHLFGVGREDGLHQGSINRRIMVGLMALRNAGLVIQLRKGDWPQVPGIGVTIYEPEELTKFFAACNAEEKLLFQVFLFSGFRAREVSTLPWVEIDWRRSILPVQVRPAYSFTPKSYEVREVPVPRQLIEALRQRRKGSKSALVFPTPAHPTRPDYGGGKPDAHHLELCKEIAYRAGLNCKACVTKSGRCKDGPYCRGWHLHKFRHTFATNMLQSGGDGLSKSIDIKTLQVLLGHKNLSTTEKYLKSLRLDRLQEKVAASSLVQYL